MENKPMIETVPKAPKSSFFEAPPKTTFVFGFISGVALMALVGIAVLLPLANRDRTASTKTVAGATTGSDGSNAPTGTNTAPTVAQLKPVSKDDHVRGPENAAITLVEFSDLQCPFCQRFHPTVQRLLQEYPDKIRWVYRHYPLTQIHPEAQPAAEAAECAGQQGKFWEYVDSLFDNQQSLAAAYYPELAKTLKLNVSKFSACLTDGIGKAKIAADVAEGNQIGVNGTPTSYLNGQEVAGAQPYETVKAQVDALLGGA
jgi:protein-disulfide isomerase